jgi:hypothetical protein
VRTGPGAARTILLSHTICARPSKQRRMVGSTLGVYSFALIFVSARTNKRHHQHLLPLLLSHNLPLPRIHYCVMGRLVHADLGLRLVVSRSTCPPLSPSPCQCADEIRAEASMTSNQASPSLPHQNHDDDHDDSHDHARERNVQVDVFSKFDLRGTLVI